MTTDFVARRARAIERETGAEIRALLSARVRPSQDLWDRHLHAWRTRLASASGVGEQP